MAACKWGTRNANMITISGGGLTATSDGASYWRSAMGTVGVDASYPGGRYFEVVLNSAPTSVMIGVAKINAPLREPYRTALAWFYQTEGHVWHADSYKTPGASYGNGDRVGFLIKNGKLYIRKNGTWQNSGNPDAETGYVASGITGVVYPIVSFYGTENVTLHCGTTITGSLPTGVLRWDQAVTVSLNLKTPAGADFASESVKWSVFPVATPDLIAEADASGTGTTSSGGVLDIAYRGSALEDGDTCLVAISNTAGVAGDQCQSMFAPATVSVAA